jgi:hypothetical protein
MTTPQYTLHSSYREILIEHLLVGEIMRRLWQRGIAEFEGLTPRVDDSGYAVYPSSLRRFGKGRLTTTEGSGSTRRPGGRTRGCRLRPHLVSWCHASYLLQR